MENLEARRLLAADPAALIANGFAPIEWEGQTVYAKPDQWIAKLDAVKGAPGKQLEAINAALDHAAAAKGLKAVKHLGGDGLVLIQSTTGKKKLGEVKESLGRAKGLRPSLVEPDFALWSEATAANDTYYSGYQYGLNNAGQTGGTPDADIDAPEAWDIVTGDGSVVVGVIDSGIDYSHPDLSANIWRNPGEVAGNGLDDDGNGYKDDVYGWDFYSNDNSPMDDDGHGTHVAGTIAAAGNNGTGVTGAAWNAKLMALKFLGADGTGTLSGALGAIHYATDMRAKHGVNVRVTNNSWGGGGYSSTLYDAIARSAQAGILFVAAAGNGGSDGIGDNNDLYPEYPAGYNVDNVISVAATDHNDVLASFSNYGATTVDLAAPGVNIASTYPGNGYVYMSGTSMATPFVSGVAALAWSYNPDASYHSVRNAMLKGVDVVSGLSGKIAAGGRLNAHKTLLNMPSPLAAPAAPSGLAATASGSQVNLAWTDNSGNEDGFKIERSTDGGTTFAQVATIGAGVTSYGDAGRASATTYTYRVRAHNAAGDSAYSNSASATTADTVAPSAPTNLSITGSTDSSVSLSWTASSDDVAVSGYHVLRDGALVGTTTKTTYTDIGLSASTAYAYTIKAYDAAGNLSPASNAASGTTKSASDTQAPSTPTALSVSGTTASSVSLSWTASTDNVAVAGYQVLRDGVQVGTTSGTNYTDTGLSSATAYAYTVRAYDAARNVSAASNTASATTQQDVPAAPSGLAATAVSSSQIDLSWADNSTNEDGSEIFVSIDGGATFFAIGTVGANTTAVGVIGVSADTTYHFRVRAYNAAGSSADSNTAWARTPSNVTTPLAPSSLAAAAASTSEVNLSWTDNSGDEQGFSIERKAGSTGTWAEVATVGAGVTAWQDLGLSASTTYYYRVRAYNSAGSSSYSNEAAATTAAAAMAITQTADIGNVAAAGSAAYDPNTGVYTLRGSGADVWSKADEFRFAYTTLTGDGEIVARVSSLQASDGGAKAGVMFRETLGAGSRNAFMAVTPGNGLTFQYRSRTNSWTSGSTVSGTAPQWVKLVRTGSTVTGFNSLDGVTWTKVGYKTVSMASTIYVGIGVTSHADGTLATATFDNVSINSAAAASTADTGSLNGVQGNHIGATGSPFSDMPIRPYGSMTVESLLGNGADDDDALRARLLELPA